MSYLVVFALGLVVAAWPCFRFGIYAMWLEHERFKKDARDGVREIAEWAHGIYTSLPSAPNQEVLARIEQLRHFGDSSWRPAPTKEGG